MSPQDLRLSDNRVSSVGLAALADRLSRGALPACTSLMVNGNLGRTLGVQAALAQRRRGGSALVPRSQSGIKRLWQDAAITSSTAAAMAAVDTRDAEVSALEKREGEASSFKHGEASERGEFGEGEKVVEGAHAEGSYRQVASAAVGAIVEGGVEETPGEEAQRQQLPQYMVVQQQVQTRELGTLSRERKVAGLQPKARRANANAAGKAESWVVDRGGEVAVPIEPAAMPPPQAQTLKLEPKPSGLAAGKRAAETTEGHCWSYRAKPTESSLKPDLPSPQLKSPPGLKTATGKGADRAPKRSARQRAALSTSVAYI